MEYIRKMCASVQRDDFAERENEQRMKKKEKLSIMKEKYKNNAVDIKKNTPNKNNIPHQPND